MYFECYICTVQILTSTLHQCAALSLNNWIGEFCLRRRVASGLKRSLDSLLWVAFLCCCTVFMLPSLFQLPENTYFKEIKIWNTLPVGVNKGSLFVFLYFGKACLRLECFSVTDHLLRHCDFCVRMIHALHNRTDLHFSPAVVLFAFRFHLHQSVFLVLVRFCTLWGTIINIDTKFSSSFCGQHISALPPTVF